jgi:hypothetical protein
VNEIEGKVIELCSEDDWGVWELWWAIGGTSDSSPATAELKSSFAKTLCELIAQGKLAAKRRDALTPITGQAKPADFSEDLLWAELNEIHTPRPDTMYWFGTP